MGLPRYTNVISFIPQFDYDYNICFLANLVDVADGDTMEHVFSMELEEFDLVALLEKIQFSSHVRRK
jgi:hypothetical protein